MIEAVQEYCKEYGLINPGSRILVGLSGGADSVALLLVLKSLSNELGINIVAAHLNHGFRGLEAATDAEFAEALCQRLEIICEVGFVDVPKLIAERSGSPQAVAREARFEFLAKIAKRYNCDSVALGHHLDDLAETLLFNLVRGTGLDGLAAMAPAGSGLYGLKIIRPLLGQRRTQIEQFLATLGQDYRIDSSNNHDDYSRNYLRLRVLPLLANLNPKVNESFARVSAMLSIDAAYIDKAVNEVWPQVVTATNEGTALKKECLCSLDAAVATRLVRKAWQQDENLELSYQHVMAILGLCGKQAGKKIELPGGAIALRTPTSIVLMRTPVGKPYELKLTVPGRVVLPFGYNLSAEIIHNLSETELHQKDLFTAYLASDASSFVVRTRLPGDRYCPLGTAGSKKLKEAMSEAQIPAPLRSLWPIVVDGENIVWVPGMRVSELARVRTLEIAVKLQLTCGGN